jgi:hypothetical protein
MLDYVYGHDEIVAGFVAAMIPAAQDRGFGRCKAIGVVDGDQLIAGLVYHNWNPEAGVIEMSAAAIPGRQWLTRETIRQMYQYPFLQIGCQMMLQLTPASDERLLRQLSALNYTFVRIPRLLGRDSDGVVCLLTREAWQDNKFNKRLGHHRDVLQLATREAA